MITGFPSPAQGYEQHQTDFNSYIIKHPSATVVMPYALQSARCGLVWWHPLRS